MSEASEKALAENAGKWEFLKGKGGSHAPKRIYRFQYADVAALRGVKTEACRKWFQRKGWKLHRDDPVGNLKKVAIYAMEAEKFRLANYVESHEDRQRKGLEW